MHPSLAYMTLGVPKHVVAVILIGVVPLPFRFDQLTSSINMYHMGIAKKLGTLFDFNLVYIILIGSNQRTFIPRNITKTSSSCPGPPGMDINHFQKYAILTGKCLYYT